MGNSWKRAAVLALVLTLVVCPLAAAARANEEQPAGSLDRSRFLDNAAGNEFSPGRLLLKMLLGLAAVLILLFLMGKAVAGRFGLPPGTARYLAVLDTLPLGPGKGLMIVKAGNKYYLLGVGGERINLLTELSAADLASSSVESADFAAVLAQTQPARPSSNWQQTVDAIRRQVWHLRRGDRKGEDEL